jgi:hypothetical protein
LICKFLTARPIVNKFIETPVVLTFLFPRRFVSNFTNVCTLLGDLWCHTQAPAAQMALANQRRAQYLQQMASLKAQGPAPGPGAFSL